MSAEEDERLAKMERSQERIERAILGEPDLGQPGLVSRVNNHAKRIKALERIGVYIGGIAAAISAAWTVWSQWPRK